MFAKPRLSLSPLAPNLHRGHFRAEYINGDQYGLSPYSDAGKYSALLEGMLAAPYSQYPNNVRSVNGASNAGCVEPTSHFRLCKTLFATKGKTSF